MRLTKLRFIVLEGVIDFTVVDNASKNHTFQIKAGDLFLLKSGINHSLFGVKNASILVTIRL